MKIQKLIHQKILYSSLNSGLNIHHKSETNITIEATITAISNFLEKSIKP